MGAPLDLLLINPGERARSYQSLGDSVAAVEPPIRAGLLATFARRRGHSAAILDANAENLGPEEVAGRVADMSPLLTTVVVYGHNPSASTQVMPAAGGICREIRRRTPAAKILLVGGHVAALPERTLREEAADFVCDGEGPYTIVSLLEVLSSHGEKGMETVDGLWYRDGSELLHTSSAPLVKDLDGEMPGVAWDLLPMGKYRAHNWHCFGESARSPYAAIYTSLGCPFRCSFCCIQAPFRSGSPSGAPAYRMWKPGTVIREIDTLVSDYGVRHIKIADELFILNVSHVEGLCDLLIERGYDLNIWAYARIDTVRPELLAKMRRAGIRWLAVGIESAVDRVLEDSRKGHSGVEARAVIAAIRAAGIHVIGNFIFGLPEDDLGTMRETLDLALDLKCEFANFSCAMAYPGSELHDAAIREGLPLPASWSGYSQYAEDALPLPTKYVSGATVLTFRDQAFQRYFRNPGYLDHVTRTFGAKVADSIREMASHTLRRER